MVLVLSARLRFYGLMLNKKVGAAFGCADKFNN